MKIRGIPKDGLTLKSMQRIQLENKKYIFKKGLKNIIESIKIGIISIRASKSKFWNDCRGDLKMRRN